MVLIFSAAAAHAQGAVGTTHEFRALVIEAIQDNDDMDFTSNDFAWEMTRIYGRKSATALIRAADSDVELRIAGAVWDLFQNKVTCRLEAQAGSSLDTCRSNGQRLRVLALSESGIDPRRLYSHAQ
jgi:hypothetical protein